MPARIPWIFRITAVVRRLLNRWRGDWGLDLTTCDILLDTLEQGQILRRTPKDAYVKAGLGY